MCRLTGIGIGIGEYRQFFENWHRNRNRYFFSIGIGKKFEIGTSLEFKDQLEGGRT